MKTNCIITASLLVAIGALNASCSTEKKNVSRAQSNTTSATEMVTTPTQTAVAESMKNHDAYYTIVEFEKGQNTLSQNNKKSIKAFIEKAQKEGKEIDDIKIMVWADKEYPLQGAKIDRQDVKVAEDRSEAIEKYLKKDLDAEGNYASYNMAKRPNKVNEFFKGDDYKTKKTFEESGASPTSASDNLATFMNNKASKALIMVDYE